MTPNEAVVMVAQSRQGLYRDFERYKRQADANEWTIGAASVEYAMLGAGTPVLWRHDIAAAALEASSSLPDDVTLSAELLTMMPIHLFETPMRFDGLDEEIAAIGCGALLVGDGKDMVFIYAYRHHPKHFGELEARKCIGIAVGKNLNEVTSGEMHDMRQKDDTPGLRNVGRGLARFVVSCWLWMHQTILRTEDVSAGKSARRMAALAGVRDQVKVIHLRRMDRSNTERAESIPRDWSCQWLVSGHWRQQFLPSTGAHRPTWIAPYIKGPEDAPLKAPSKTIFKADR